MEEGKYEQLIIAEEVRLDDLSGVFKGAVSIGESEMGIVILDGQVEKTLLPGTDKLGKWKDRAVFRILNRDFTLTLNFSGLRAGDDAPVDAFIIAIVRLQSPELFYRGVMRGRKIIDAMQLAEMLSAGVEKSVQSETYKYQSDVLINDPAAAKNIMTELKGVMDNLLNERGLSLREIESAAFSPSESDDILFAEVEQLRDELKTAGKQTRETAKQMATRLWKKGLISIEEAEEMRSAGSGPAPSGGKSLISMVDTAIIRMESRLTERAQQLTARISELESKGKKPSVTGLAEWAEKGGLETDELVRRHIGRVLADSIGDIKEVKVEAHKKGFRQAADDLGKLENDVDLLRTEVEGAAYGKRSMPKKGKAKKQMIARLIVFEDSVLKSARQFPDSVEKVRTVLNDNGDPQKNVNSARETFRGLKKQFSKRGEIIAGFEG